MSQVATKLNLNKSIISNVDPVKITIQLAPEQIIQAYQKLIKREQQIKKDWLYDEPYASELKKRVKIANKEKKANKLIPAVKLHKELGF